MSVPDRVTHPTRANVLLWTGELVVTVLLVVMLCDVPGPPETWLDASWQAVLVEGHLKGWQFGRDLIFTFGPWGFLNSHFSLPGAVGAKLVWELGGKSVLLWLVVRSSRRLGGLRRGLCLGLLAVLGPLFPDTLYFVVITMLGLDLLPEPRRPAWHVIVLILVLAFLAQFKFTYSLLATAIVGLATVAAWVARERRRAAGLAAGFAAASVGWWLAAGQELGLLPSYWRYSWETASGYPGAMAFDESWAVFGLGAASAVLTAVLLWRTARPAGAWSLPGLFPALAAAAAWFLAWKHGFTRADGHVLGYFYFSLIAGLALPVWLQARRRPSWFDLGVVVCVAGIAAADWNGFKRIPTGTRDRWLSNFRTLGHLPDFPEHFAAAYREAERTHADPALRTLVGPGTVDWIGYEQGRLLLNGSNHRPRPIFQSYSAYTARLMRKNWGLYQGATAPEFAVATLQTIDGRFPTQDDSLILADLPRWYEVAAATAERVVFRRLPGAGTSPTSREPAGQVFFHLGDEIPVPPQRDQVLWMRVHLPQTKLGKLRSLFYRPPILHLSVEEDSGRRTTHRIIPAIATEGFLIAPFLEDAADLAAFAGGKGGKWIRTMRFEPAHPSEAEYWGYGRVEFFRIPELAMQATNPMGRLVDLGIANTAPASVSSGVTVQYIPSGPNRAILVHAPGEIVFQRRADDMALAGSFGISEGAYTNDARTDGADFRIEAGFADGSTRLLWNRVLAPLTVPGDRGPQNFRVDLPADAVRLTLRTTPGAADNNSWDWTYWLQLRFSP